MRDHVDLAKARWRVCPVVERPARHLASKHRVDTKPPPAHPSVRNSDIDQHSIARRRTHPSEYRTVFLGGFSRTCPSSAGNSAGIIDTRRLPQTRSEAS